MIDAIKKINVDDLIPYVNNAKLHSDSQVTKIASSIAEFGFNNPVLTDGKNGVIAGHGRLMAAKKLGLKEVPVIELSHLSKAQKKAYILADNKLGEVGGGWDDELLKIELDDLKELDFDISDLGFDDIKEEEFLGFESGGVLESPKNSGIDYEEKFSIIVVCKDEIEQSVLYDKLTGQGLECKVLVN